MKTLHTPGSGAGIIKFMDEAYTPPVRLGPIIQPNDIPRLLVALLFGSVMWLLLLIGAGAFLVWVATILPIELQIATGCAAAFTLVALLGVYVLKQIDP